MRRDTYRIILLRQRPVAVLLRHIARSSRARERLQIKRSRRGPSREAGPELAALVPLWRRDTNPFGVDDHSRRRVISDNTLDEERLKWRFLRSRMLMGSCRRPTVLKTKISGCEELRFGAITRRECADCLLDTRLAMRAQLIGGNGNPADKFSGKKRTRERTVATSDWREVGERGRWRR